ncbi:MotA/TolQ/ExbB proton channel [Shewanella denitrificans OS217]|uniref:MotA/TolQ/ExbB proton channel n=1 Tax=Shewanella denitrificans (strain OS217 / ATCC BAA-1090 / DSM 15013) TaxID=318161 RepID=Q12M88_SHEDO|nr:MotA/TolQ/ExbB proton channel family protein [Shewanella denitrificans]ABE55438.1 MotA/TolQ/ExbB proton channel [Shewanella denitrificans OS217]
MLPEFNLAPELVTGGVVMWTIMLLALVCYGLLFEAIYCRYHQINSQWVTSWLTPLQVLISSLPLLGLLGTIIGLLDTFSALGHNPGVSISDGIGKAMLTTQAGLLMSIPAMVILWKLQEQEQELTLAPTFESAQGCGSVSQGIPEQGSELDDFVNHNSSQTTKQSRDTKRHAGSKNAA